ncbi:hypothetical protein CMK11_18890 [Candidatus Poribacteria bacterium]|nr:hypothetical protein [Candidatus Poribacteria bacterium]
MPDDPYDTLRVRPGADADEVRRAYRRQAQERHPDKVAHLGDRARRDAGARMRGIIGAYRQLSDATSRAVVDDRRRQRRARRALLAVVCASGVLVLVTALTLRLLDSREPASPQAAPRVRTTARHASDSALRAIVRATEDHPRDARAWDRRWRAELAAGRDGDAAASLLRAVQLDPTNVDLHEQRARLAVATGDTRAAATELTWLRANGFEARAGQLDGR